MKNASFSFLIALKNDNRRSQLTSSSLPKLAISVTDNLAHHQNYDQVGQKEVRAGLLQMISMELITQASVNRGEKEMHDKGVTNYIF